MAKKIEEQKTIELSAADMETLPPARPRTDRMLRPSLFQDAEGRNVIDDPFARTIIDGRYEVMRCLGTGAMGSVFLVNHLRLNKYFALKMVNPKLARLPEFLARFEREANACSRLEHPNCITVTDFGQTGDGSLFLVMEYADGKLLSELLDEPIPIADAIEYTRQILLGLKHAHGEGLVHRDIKLENVVKCRRDDDQTLLKILDFGMAKTPLKSPKNLNITTEGVVMGTPQYMAPEQIRDDDVDGRTDLYAVGVTFFRMLARRQIFDGNTHLDVFTAKLTKPVPTLKQLTGENYPEVIEAFIAKAIRKEPPDRFQNADEMLQALENMERKLEEIATKRSSFLSGGISLGKMGSWIGRRFKAVREETDAWYQCLDQEGPPTWKQRLSGLVSTRVGQIFIIRLVAVAAVFAVVGTVLTGLIESSVDEKVRSPEALPTTAAEEVTTPVPVAVPPSESLSEEQTVAEIEKKPLEPKPKPEHEPEPKPELTPPSPAPKQTTVVAEMSPSLSEATLLIERRKCRKAQKILTGIEPKTPHVFYLLGRCSVCLWQNTEALGYYRKAVTEDQTYRADSRLLADVERMLSSKKTRDDAFQFMAKDLGESALPVLITAAGHHKSRVVRQKAQAFVAKHDALDRVDMETALEMDLHQAKCKEKKAIINKLAKLNTKTARNVLIRARDAEIKEGFFRTRYRHGCVRYYIIKVLGEMKKSP